MQYKILQNRKLYEDIGKPGFNPEYVLQWIFLFKQIKKEVGVKHT